MARRVGMGGAQGNVQVNARRNRRPVPPKPKPKPPVRQKPAPRPTPPRGRRPSVGFNPERMARTLTNLGYDTEIAQIERAIEENFRQEMQAMSRLTDWSRQIEDFRGQAAGSIADVWNQAIAGGEASNQNIANLFGESASGEAMASMDPGQDMLRALGASNQSFMAYLQPILAQQGMDARARAAGEFSGQRRELMGGMRDLRREKSQAYGKNLIEMMQLGWGREGQLFDQRMAQLQAQQAQQALNQSAAMFGPELEAQQLANQAAAQQIRLNEVAAANDQKLSELQRQQARQAMRRGEIEIRQLEAQGVDLLDPEASMAVARAAMAGSLNPRGVISMNPRLALRTAFDVLASMGLADSPEAIQAVLKAFEVSLRLSHAKGAWKRWSIKNGQLVYNPVRGPRTKGPGRPD